MSTVASSPILPWDQLPNPLGLLTVAQQIQSMRSLAPRTGPVNSKNRRTAPLGRDWIGVAIERGDTVMVNYGKSFLSAKVLEIYLEDSKGVSYFDYHRSSASLVFHRPSGRLYRHMTEPVPNRGPSDPHYNSFLAEIDGNWLGTSLGFLDGLTTVGRTKLPQDYSALAPQGAKLKLEYSDGHTGYAHSYTVSVLGDHLADPGLLESYRLAQIPPLTGARINI